jgi:hypothetical protein
MTSAKNANGTLIGVLGRALVDPEFCKKVIGDREKIADEFDLSPEDREALKKLDTAQLTEAASNLAGRTDLTIKVVISGHFDAK